MDSAHPMMVHRNGDKCVWIDDRWFVPLDAGGEGYACGNPEHQEMEKNTMNIAKCNLCGRERTAEGMDAYDYSAIQVLSGQPLGWYTGEDGEVCPEDMERSVRGGA